MAEVGIHHAAQRGKMSYVIKRDEDMQIDI